MVKAPEAVSGPGQFWDARRHARLGPPFSARAEQVRGLSFLRDARLLVSAGSDGLIRLWDAASHEQRGAALTLTDFIAAFAGPARALSTELVVPAEGLRGVRSNLPATLSSDLLTVAISGGRGRIQLHDARTLQPIGAPLNELQ
jgi:WD40 repeat protein